MIIQSGNRPFTVNGIIVQSENRPSTVNGTIAPFLSPKQGHLEQRCGKARMIRMKFYWGVLILPQIGPHKKLTVGKG